MSSSVISHVIGTAALISLFLIVTVYHAYSYSMIQNGVIESQLEEIAGYISSNIVQLVSLTTLSDEDQFLIKEFKIPKYVADSLYQVTIERYVDPISQEEVFRVRVYLISKSSTYGVSYLPWSEGGSIHIYNGTDPGIPGSSLSPAVSLSSGYEEICVWSLKRGTEITVGLGRRVA
ncbi:hypothetical protein J7L06_03270 [Candidatus Bathyarchaeota archaeon]|nr:hypothetical protein [Candidatus Bathyarchaeota archaeon]